MPLNLTRRRALAGALPLSVAARPALAWNAANDDTALAEAVDAYVKKAMAAWPDQPALGIAVVKDGALYVQAGGGVVCDSDPEAEWQETVSKSRALRAAAEDAGRFSGGGNG